MWELSLGDLKKQLVSSFLSDRTSELWASIKEIQRFFQARGLGGIAAETLTWTPMGVEQGSFFKFPFFSKAMIKMMGKESLDLTSFSGKWPQMSYLISLGLSFI